MAFWTLVRAKSGAVYRIWLRWQVFLDDEGNVRTHVRPVDVRARCVVVLS
jgi:hypothetical protein